MTVLEVYQKCSSKIDQKIDQKFIKNSSRKFLIWAMLGRKF